MYCGGVDDRPTRAGPVTNLPSEDVPLLEYSPKVPLLHTGYNSEGSISRRFTLTLYNGIES